MTTVSSRDVNHDIGRAKRAASKGPVFITDRGKPAHVLLSIEEFRRLNDSAESVAELLASDDDVDFDEFLPHRSFAPRKLIFG